MPRKPPKESKKRSMLAVKPIAGKVKKMRISPEERRLERQMRRAGADRAAPIGTVASRTRGGQKTTTLRRHIQEGNPEVVARVMRDVQASIPPKTFDHQGRAHSIHSGKSRDFSAAFRAGFWARKGDGVACAKCGDPINFNARGNQARSIDHQKSWASQKVGIETHEVCKNGTHWRVSKQSAAKAIIEDESNLQPMHKGCNSSKNGAKTSDHIGPQRIGPCPHGGGCGLPTAR